jgi:acetoin utilization deacetylase AcuC-like enzyme
MQSLQKAVLNDIAVDADYHLSDDMVADSQSFSPSAAKPRPVLVRFLASGLPVSIRTFPPVTTEDLILSHDPTYVRGVLACELPNGFANLDSGVARSLPWTTGALLAAARAALNGGIACAPVSGFHHAHYDTGGGFCTFNGLTVTAQRLLTDGVVHRILILDCDQHFGDGTDDIIRRLGLAPLVENASFGRWFHSARDAAAYLTRLEQIVARFPEFDLILYQAGADVHVDDPLGGVLTTEQMVTRDRLVFQGAQRHRIPLAWNLAGGYQDPVDKVVQLHVNTLRECTVAYASSG